MWILYSISWTQTVIRQREKASYSSKKVMTSNKTTYVSLIFDRYYPKMATRELLVSSELIYWKEIHRLLTAYVNNKAPLETKQNIKKPALSSHWTFQYPIITFQPIRTKALFFQPQEALKRLSRRRVLS